MRRILRKIAEGDFANFGDTSTLLNPEIVEEIKNERIQRKSASINEKNLAKLRGFDVKLLYKVFSQQIPFDKGTAKIIIIN